MLAELGKSKWRPNNAAAVDRINQYEVCVNQSDSSIAVGNLTSQCACSIGVAGHNN